MIESWLFWAMLAGALIVHAILPLRWRFWFLVAVSIAYLCIASPNNVKMHSYAHTLILMGLALGAYYLAPLTADPRILAAKGGSVALLLPLWLRRLIFWGLIGLILGYLAFLKYIMPAEWWRGAILRYYALPLGVSYFSFKLIDMVIYSARNPTKPRSLDSYLCSVFMFPMAAAGPIERYEHFLQNAPNVSRPDDLLQGSTRIIYGLIKRFVIVELLSDQWRYVTRGALWEHLFQTSTWRLWWAAFSVFLYLYIDFSAYSDIAIGCCRLFGIRLMENFDWPILAPNIASFWKRWHMTLTGWCVSYVYMPIVGATRRLNLAMFATFVAIGLWHGTFKSNIPWLLWGIYNGLGMIGYGYWVRIKRFYKWAWCNHWMWYGAGIAMTLMFVCVGDLLALAEPRNFAQAGRILMRMSFIPVHHA